MLDQIRDVFEREFRERAMEQPDQFHRWNLAPLQYQDQCLLGKDGPGLGGRNGRFDPGLRPFLGYSQRQQEGVVVGRQKRQFLRPPARRPVRPMR